MMNDLQIWLGRLNRAEASLDKNRSIWENSIRLYDCSFFNKHYGGIDPERVDVHFANWYITNVVNMAYFRDPYIFTKSENSKYDTFADTMEKLINKYWKRLKLKSQFKKCILSAGITPPGWMKVGYTARIEDDLTKLEDIKQKSVIQNIKDVLLGKKEDEDSETVEEKGILSLDIKEESIFASWVSSWNILMPPGFNQIKDMPWMAEIESVPLVDFMRNPLYKNKKDVKGTRDISEKDTGSSIMTKPSYNREPTSSDDETQIIKLYHVWSRRDRERVTLSDNGIHFKGDWPYDMEGFPYRPLQFEDTLPTPEQSNLYPINIVTPILPQILELSNARTMMVKHRRRCNVIITVPKGFYTEGEINQIEENGSVMIVEVPAGAQPTGFQVPSLPPDVYNIDKIIMQDLQMATNMGQMMFQAQPGQRTASQANIAQQGLQLKAQSRVDAVEGFTMDIAQCMAQLAWQFHDRDEVSKIIGEEVTPDMWPDLPEDKNERRQVIQDLNLKIDAGSTAPPKDETVDRKQLLDFLSFAASFAPERLKKDEVIKAGIKRWKFVKDIDKIVITGDQDEASKAEGENQLMLQGHPQIVGPNENHMIHIQIHEKVKGNSLVDEHIVRHGQKLGIQPQSGKSNKPQKGDVRSPRISQNPEMTRQGLPSPASVNQSIQNQGVGTGKEGF